MWQTSALALCSPSSLLMANGPCNEQGPEWAPSAHARGLFAAANVSCGGGMLMFQAGRHVAMPQRQWRPYARAAARVTEPQEQCRLETAALARGVDHPEIPIPSPSPTRDGRKLSGKPEPKLLHASPLISPVAPPGQSGKLVRSHCAEKSKSGIRYKAHTSDVRRAACGSSPEFR